MICIDQNQIVKSVTSATKTSNTLMVGKPAARSGVWNLEFLSPEKNVHRYFV